MLNKNLTHPKCLHDLLITISNDYLQSEGVTLDNLHLIKTRRNNISIDINTFNITTIFFILQKIFSHD
jgi:hypothetical protein